jgi:hypothetical protein
VAGRQSQEALPVVDNVESEQEQVLNWMAGWLRRGKSKLPQDFRADYTRTLKSTFWSEEGRDHFLDVTAPSREIPANDPLLQGTMDWARCWQLQQPGTNVLIDAEPHIGTPKVLVDSQDKAS